MLKAAAERDKLARPYEKDMRAFGELIRKDTAVLNQLDATSDRAAFVKLYCELAAKQGFNFTPQDMAVAIQEQKNGSDWILPGSITRMIAERF